jgi:N-methylhydantoinase B
VTSFFRSVDPITFEVVAHRLHQIAREMGTTLERVGGTANTTQMHDYMASLYRPDGAVLSAGESLAFHVACAGFAVKRIIERFESDGGIEPDDVFLLNDPYLAAIHQSDMYMISPIHYQNRLVAWSATFVHVMDIGARSPGGNSPEATEIFHEGLRIPGLKLVEHGKLRRDVFDALINMTRQPAMVALDLKCEIAANNVAKDRMLEMFDQYGPELIDAVSAELIHYTESMLRGRLKEVPDGEWRESAVIEASATGRWRTTLRLKKSGDSLHFDFAGSDPQATLGINLPYHATVGACFDVVLTTLGYDLPKNHGASRVLEVVAPEGTVVNVKYPGPVSMNTTSGIVTVRYLVCATLSQMLATSEKWRREVMSVITGHRAIRHAGVNQYGKYYVSSLLELDGSGATSFHDGTDSVGNLLSFPLSCHNVEWAELNFPLIYLFRRHILDGGGAGQYRGGTGVETAVTVHEAPEGQIRGISFGVIGLTNSGRGVFGGYPAAPSIAYLLEKTTIAELLAENRWPESLHEIGGKKKDLGYCNFDIDANDVLYLRRASGGGYGDPLEREPAAVWNDVKSRFVSNEAAREVYGVVVHEGHKTFDGYATIRLRQRMRQERE